MLGSGAMRRLATAMASPAWEQAAESIIDTVPIVEAADAGVDA
jgi:hypothetical protein